MTMTKEEKKHIITDYNRHDGDTGSPEVQVAIISNRISHLTDHLRIHKHDESSRRGLLKLVGQRRRHLSYLRKRDPRAYMEITDRLGIRRK